jgi:hypothetical protein
MATATATAKMTTRRRKPRRSRRRGTTLGLPPPSVSGALLGGGVTRAGRPEEWQGRGVGLGREGGAGGGGGAEAVRRRQGGGCEGAARARRHHRVHHHDRLPLPQGERALAHAGCGLRTLAALAAHVTRALRPRRADVALCAQNVTITLGPNVNFIHGENGSEALCCSASCLTRVPLCGAQAAKAPFLWPCRRVWGLAPPTPLAQRVWEISSATGKSAPAARAWRPRSAHRARVRQNGHGRGRARQPRPAGLQAPRVRREDQDQARDHLPGGKHVHHFRPRQT